MKVSTAKKNYTRGKEVFRYERISFTGKVDFDFTSESANIWLNFNNGYAGYLEFKNSCWSFSVVNEYRRVGWKDSFYGKRPSMSIGRDNFKQYARLHNCWKTWNLHNHDLLEAVTFVSTWLNSRSGTVRGTSLGKGDGEVLTFFAGGLGLHRELENGLTVSIVMHEMSYGGERGLWELGVWQTKNPDKWMTMDIFNSDDDVVGFMNTRRVAEHLQTIEEWRNENS